MASDTEKQPKAKSKKRRRIVISETDSSDECDSPTVKTRRKQRINRIKNEIRILSKEKDRELQAAGSSQNESHITTIECEKNAEPQINGKIPSDDSKLARSLLDPIIPDTGKASNKPETDGAVATCSKSDVNVENKDDNKTPDKCPICWTSFTNQEVAIPICCEHSFCLHCLIEWSKNTNTCPIDRRIFTMIDVRESPGGLTTRSIPIETSNNNREDENSHSDENSPNYQDSFSSTNEGTNSWPEENNERHDIFPFSRESSLSPYDSDARGYPAYISAGEYSWSSQEDNHSTDDEQMRNPSWLFESERNFSSNQEENEERNSSSNEENEERNSSSNEENEERNSSSNEENEERNFSSNQENEERNSSSNEENEERNFSSNQDDEERSHSSNRDDDDNYHDERNYSSNRDDTASNSSSNRNDWPSSPNVDYYSTPDRINSSTSGENNSAPSIQYSHSSGSATSNHSCSTSLANSYSSPIHEESHSSPDCFSSPSPSSPFSPSSGSATSYSS